ncbi:MAG: type II toxin-antitoxin system VapC family toxin [Actinomycetota bacterium]|nr:type II toxin-antitoxin system VapC family toxin [Actinomycetota bacterium]
MARTRRRNQDPPPQRLILDSGAVIALSRNDQRARAALAAAWEAGVEVSIPSLVVAETVRGSAKDAPVNRVIKAVGEVRPADEGTGRVAGGLLGAARSNSTVDAVVVASAIELGGGVVLTGDPDDLEAFAIGHPEVVVRTL